MRKEIEITLADVPEIRPADLLDVAEAAPEAPAERPERGRPIGTGCL